MDSYKWLWVYVAVEPSTGDSFCWLLPHVDSQCLNIFVNKLDEYLNGKRVGLVMDNSGAHRSTSVVWSQKIEPWYLPAYSPELNPAEAVFRYLRAALSNQVFDNLSDLEAAIKEALSEFWHHPASLQSLTGYPWWLQAIDDIAPLAS